MRLESVRVGEPVAVVVERAGAEHAFDLQAGPATREQLEYWLLTYVHQHFSPEIYAAYEARLGHGLERAPPPP